MDRTSEDTTRTAAEHNAARNAERAEPTTNDEVAAARESLRLVGPYLEQWRDGMTPLMGVEDRETVAVELKRLTRIGSIVGELITEARAHTREASRIIHRQFPEAGSADQ
jgi:hypothetical protein